MVCGDGLDGYFSVEVVISSTCLGIGWASAAVALG